MAGALLTTLTALTCPHGGAVVAAPSPAAAVRVAAGVALSVADPFTVLGCPFTTPGGTPSPCLTVQWTSAETGLLVGGAPALTTSSVGLCLGPGGVPQGGVMVHGSQGSALAGGGAP